MTLLVRIVLLPLGLGVAAASMVHAASEALPGALGSASMTTSLNGQALTALVDRGFGAEMAAKTAEGQADLPSLSDGLLTLAHDAFAVDPLEVSTIRTIAVGGVRGKDPERARQVMRLAAQLSKRDSVTDLWLAQDYAQSGDVGAMTASFDQALRTSVRAREIGDDAAGQHARQRGQLHPARRADRATPRMGGRFLADLRAQSDRVAAFGALLRADQAADRPADAR